MGVPGTTVLSSSSEGVTVNVTKKTKHTCMTECPRCSAVLHFYSKRQKDFYWSCNAFTFPLHRLRFGHMVTDTKRGDVR